MKSVNIIKSQSFKMLYCYECQASFKRLRELKKHERVHRRISKCSSCDKYFTSREQELKHRRESHTINMGTQTEPPSRTRRWSKAPRWRPAVGSAPPTPRREVESIVAAPSTASQTADDEWVLELNDPVPLE